MLYGTRTLTWKPLTGSPSLSVAEKWASLCKCTFLWVTRGSSDPSALWVSHLQIVPQSFRVTTTKPLTITGPNVGEVEECPSDRRERETEIETETERHREIDRDRDRDRERQRDRETER